ncbi:hypothetical protein ACVR1I_02595 [Streptococcus cameli]
MKVTLEFEPGDFLGFYPRRFEIEEKYEGWMYPHVNLSTGELDSIDVVYLFRWSEGTEKISHIYIFSEKKSNFEDLDHIGKIINLVHDISTEFECFFEEVRDINNNEIRASEDPKFDYHIYILYTIYSRCEN